MSAIARVLWFCFGGVGFAEIGVLAFKCILYLFIEWSCGEDKADNMVLKIGIEKKNQGNFKKSFSVFKQYYTYFYTFFYSYIFLKITNNTIQTLLSNRSSISLVLEVFIGLK